MEEVIAQEHETWDLWQGGQIVASVSGPAHAARMEIKHYAAVYSQDGPCEIRRGSDEDFEDEET